ncbi:hypothetical protein [Magnetospirillum molischianum]|uniref:hypothetical protein n=1 Tax=Magnetospirillum molischianum TaxID=1083 RepID=UPI0003122D65|nr:hypothetical protein [Magnetospirillum molischianum]
MTDANTDLVSAGKIAKELGISDARVKNAITKLGLDPTAKRGACSLYDRNAVERIKETFQG